MGRPLPAIVVGIVVVAAATWTVLPVSNAPAEEDTAGFVVYIDPETGEPTVPSPGALPVQLNAKTRYAFSSSFEGLKRTSSPVPGGGITLHLEGRFQHGYVAAGDGGGGLKLPCISGIPHDEDYVWTSPSIDDGGAAVKRTYPPREAAAGGATIIIQNNDDPLEGFNDPTPWTPTGGNPATTLGEARLNCFERAAEIWGGLINSDVVIIVRAAMDELDCAPLYGVLGSAGAVSLNANFNGAPQPNTWYPVALANALAGQDLIPAHPDISATFNSLLNGNPGCLLGAGWYYGFDESPGTNEIDFVSVLVHEFGHGLGFATYGSMLTGIKPDGFDDAYSLHLDQVGAFPSYYPDMTNQGRADANISDPDLRWIGLNVTLAWPLIPLRDGLADETVRVHAPSPIQLGSSVSHWSGDVRPDEAMEPVYTDPIHDPGLALWLMKDIGWEVDSLPRQDDDIAPDAPQNLVVFPVGGLNRLSWDPNTEPDVQAYRIYRANDPDFPTLIWSFVEETTSTSWLDPDFGGSGLYYSVTAVDNAGNESDPASASLPESPLAAASALHQNVPNPFNPTTTIQYDVGRSGKVTIQIFDVSGRLVKTLVNTPQSEGQKSTTWDGRNNAGERVGSGLYFYRLNAPGFTQTRRMVVLK